MRVSDTAVSLLNQAFRLELNGTDVLGSKIRDLAIPREMALPWQEALEAVANGTMSGEEALLAVGKPGRPAMDHIVMDRVTVDSGEQTAVLAIVAPCREEEFESTEYMRRETPSGKTLKSIPYPLIFFRSVRAPEGTVADFTCLAMNSAAGKLLQLNDRFQFGRSLPEIFIDDVPRDVLFVYACEAVKTGKFSEFELEFKLRVEDEEPRLLRFWLCKFGDGVGFLFQDVTATRRIERQLMQYRHAFSHMDEAIIVTDLDGNIIDWNPASERMFGYHKEEIIGQPADILTQDTSGGQLKQSSRTVL
ncbi:MAG: PAS domain S-box protein, partial [Chlorobiales bacterium]|nr:PAS domain S-box protein [Chlorobiales bacterium]